MACCCVTPKVLLAGAVLCLLLCLLLLCTGRGPLSLRLLRVYPKRMASRVVGWAAERPLPRSARSLVLGAFARHFQIAVEEAEHPLLDYPSLQAFFTRRLKAGLRPQDPEVPGFLNSPVDGRILAWGRIEADTVLQAKGLAYRVSELLKHDTDPARFEGGYYLTLYLSPRDYHRIHVPCRGRVRFATRVEGELWPVNDASTANVSGLYERNRRAAWIARGSGPCEGLEVAAVAVGALHVGGVVIDARWLEGRSLPRDGGLAIPDLPCAPGEDLGLFQFGSTVVLLIGGPRARDWVPACTEGNVPVGRRLGSFP